MLVTACRRTWKNGGARTVTEPSHDELSAVVLLVGYVFEVVN